jgi:precorrin-3B C17-methyltransferase
MRSSSNSSKQAGKIDHIKEKKSKRNNSSGPKTLFVVGIGPGHQDYLSKRAFHILKTVDTIAGYTVYIDLIRDVISKHQNIVSTGMKKEKERVLTAIKTVLNGNSCALVSSGDPGIYAMAGLVYEICKENDIKLIPLGIKKQDELLEQSLCIEIIPGIPALCAGASVLGAPLMHDFAAISLSDLLTPWKTIEARIEAAAKADFVIVIYNPKSKKRISQIIKTQQIIMKYREGDTPVGIVKGAMRENQQVCIVPLKNLHEANIDMQTTVFIGSTNTSIYCDFMVTPRGYTDKYCLEINGSH